jgi:hypothetical protein
MNIQGVGEIYEVNKKRAKVRYDLSIEKEYMTARAFDGSQVVESGQSGSGSIYDVQDGRIDLIADMSKILTLHMDNGHKQDFLIRDYDEKTGRFFILLSGKFY